MTKPELTAISRIAMRTARRNWKRTVLIIALIALPVAVSQIAAGVAAARKVSPEEIVVQQLGSADALIQSFAPTSKSVDWVEEQLADLAPGAPTLRFRNTWGSIPGTSAFVEITDLDISEPLARGKLALVDGSLPSDGEVLVSDGLVALGGVSIGDEIYLTVDGLAEAKVLEIVGVFRDVLYRNRRVVVVGPQELDVLYAEVPNTREFATRDVSWLVASPDPDALTGAVHARWERDRSNFGPEPAQLKPAALAFLDDEVFGLLDSQQVAELAALAASLDPGGYATPGYSPSDQASSEAYNAFISAVYQRADLLIGSDGPVFPQLVANTSTTLYFEEFGAERVLQVPAVMGTIVAALLMAEVALVAGAAYATGIRRRLREVGLLAVNGATTTHVHWMVVGEGLISGLLGAGIGSVLALTVMTAGRPIVQRVVDRSIVGTPLGIFELLAPALVGVAAATIAAWIPGRAAATVPAVTALDGRMPLAAPRRWVVPLGVAITGFGTFLLVVAKASFGQSGTVQAGLGVALIIGGFALMAGPIVEWVGRRADRFPAVVRLVLRDSARQRTRAATAIAATMVVLVAPVVAGAAIKTDAARSSVYGLSENPAHVLVASPSAYDMPPGADVDPDEVAKVAAILPFANQVPLDVFEAAGVFTGSSSVVANGPLLAGGLPQDAMVVARATPELLAALGIVEAVDESAGRAVVLGVADRDVQVRIGDSLVDALEVPVHIMQCGFPRILVDDDLAASLQLGEPTTAALFVNDRPLTDADRLRLGEAVSGARAVWPAAFTSAQLSWMVGGGALLVVLLIVALVTALAATESDNDIRTMVAVGAPPHIRRRFLGVQTVYYTLFAALLATPLAMLLLKMSITDSWIDVGPFGSFASARIAIPWLMIGIVMIGIPAVVGGLTAITVRSAATVAPRRLG